MFRPRISTSQSVILLDRNFQLGGNLFFRRRPLEALFGHRNGGFDLLGLTAFLPRRPVQAAQAVQNGPANFVLGVGLEFDVLAGVEVVNRRNQAEYARGHQVFQDDVVGQALLDAPRDEPHLRQVLQDEPLAFRVTEYCDTKFEYIHPPPEGSIVRKRGFL